MRKIESTAVFSIFLGCIVFSVIAGIFIFTVKRVTATVSACTVTASPNSVPSFSSSDLVFRINNTDSVAFDWIKITSPHPNFQINFGSATGWSGEGSGDATTLTGGTIPAGESLNVDVSVSSDDVVSSQTWTVEVSDDSGATTFACSGSPSIAIVDPNDTPEISDIVVSDISSTTAKVTWTTNEAANSIINYGTTESYGSTKTSTTLSTSHSLTIDGLSANTKYYFEVQSSDAGGNTGTSGAASFTTAAPGLTGATVTITTTTTKLITPTPTPTPVPDRIGPAIIIDTNLSKPFKEPPTIKGRARDGSRVVEVEYSIDGGNNWMTVDDPIKSSTSIIFEFTPPQLDDDNYKMKVRAKDSVGNIGISKEQTLIIDRLPPLVGSSIFTLGPQILRSSNGTYYGLENMSQKITLSAIGGPVRIDVLSNIKSFSATKNLDNGLWSADLNFQEPGTHPLTVKSVDGAGNKTSRTLQSVIILPSGTVTGGNGPIKGAKLSLFVKEYHTKRFVLWDGAAFGQQNPELTDSSGKYQFFIPPGTYYIELTAPSYKSQRTEIFTIDAPRPINVDFLMERQEYISLGTLKIPFFNFSVKTIPIHIADIGFEQASSPIIGKKLPGISLKDENESVLVGSFTGKPVVVSILNSWDPNTFLQLEILERLNENNAINVVTIFEQETSSRLSIFKKRGEYDLTMLADQDGELFEPLDIQALPMHLFLDRKGVVEKVRYGVLTQNEIEENLIN